MLKYQTIFESSTFKLSKVKNTTTNKSWYSLLYRCGWYPKYPISDQMVNSLGPCKFIDVGMEWKIKDRKVAIKKYNWSLLKWG